jgi:hypothetical protein
MITVAAGSRSGASSSITGSLRAIGVDHFIDHFVNDLAEILSVGLRTPFLGRTLHDQRRWSTIEFDS